MNVIKVVIVLMPQYLVLTEALFILKLVCDQSKVLQLVSCSHSTSLVILNLQNRGFEQKQPQAAQIFIPGQSVCLWATVLGNGAKL